MRGLRWVDRDGQIVPVVDGHEVTWAPQAGSQRAFLECPVEECLLEGNRGGGKTESLVMDFAQHVGQGYGAEWTGILFRKTYKQLSDVVRKTQKWFPRIWPAAKFNSSDMYWRWPGGEMLHLKYMEREDDYWNYHGHGYPWIGWEELTTWASDKCYRVMMSCWRSPHPDIPRKYRATTNPYGVGHNWVKRRFGLPVPYGGVVGPVIREGGDPERVAIHSDLRENKVLMRADPGYANKIAAAARNPSEKRAWLEGSWDIVAGGMFDDLWSPHHHVLPNIPFGAIPSRWKINRSYDHGQSKPFSVGWWAESNGEPIEHSGRLVGPVPGDLVRIAEWYGWNGTENEGLRMLATDIGDGIIERETDWTLVGRILPGPADSSIFDEVEPGKSVAGDMKRRGVRWTHADKRPGSRVQGWQQIRNLLSGAIPGRDGTREEPGLFVCQRCENFLRTVPVLPRDDKNLDDVDTDAEDHVGDETRYRVRQKISVSTKSREWSERSRGRRRSRSRSF